MDSELREIFSDEETEKAKQEIREKLTDIFKGDKNLDDQKNSFWYGIVEPGWSPTGIKELVKKEGSYTELICQFESQMMEDVLTEMGYDIEILF